MSLGMFTAIPLPRNKWEESCVGLMIPSMPAAGAVIGLIWAGLAWVLLRAGAPSAITAAALSLAPFILTGFLHLDGYMDTCDAVLSRRPLEEKLRILKDPHTGAFAVIAVMALFIMQYASLDAITEGIADIAAFAFIPVISRALSAMAVLCLKPMAQSGYARMFYEKSRTAHKIAVLVIIAISAVSFALHSALCGIVIFLAMTLAFILAVFPAYREFSGISGDITGFALVISELAGLLAWALLQ
ncbi:MAG: adenosylcobinamide-GDP ribazoletransferase [Clostridiales bacterium]|nr:adenosylcobinamide-GDP ribazoletransferase [Clostridiales bacterium]